MGVFIFDSNDEDYFQWIKPNWKGYVINTTRGLEPNYMVLHRADCHTIAEYSGKAEWGGFTERDYIKICANNLEDLRDWVRQNGRPDGSFSSECQFCSPLYDWEQDDEADFD